MPQQPIHFNEKALELQALAREIADKHVRPAAAKHDKAQEYNFEAARAVADAGLFRTFIPEEYGGHGAGVLALALVAEELAKADSGFGVAFAVNALGSFIFGALIESFAVAVMPSAEIRALIFVGVLGSFTTFSAFSSDTYLLLERGEIGRALLYIFISVAISLGAFFVGLRLLRLILA